MIGEQELFDRLGGAQRNGAGWLARCPAHADEKPSLSVKRDDGRWLLHCHAGCSFEDVRDALGLRPEDLAEQRNGRGGRIVDAYDYVDEDGQLLYQVVRFEPKDFRQRKPDGAGGWEWKLGHTRRVLYRLPEVRAGVARGERVFIVEGEKDVHAVERADAVATCNPQGAGKWRRAYAEVLRGARVVVVADRDESGRKHAEAVARSLDRIAASVEVVEPAEGKDAADHLGAGHGLDAFVECPVGVRQVFGQGPNTCRTLKALQISHLCRAFGVFGRFRGSKERRAAGAGVRAAHPRGAALPPRRPVRVA